MSSSSQLKKLVAQNYYMGFFLKHPALGQKIIQMTITQEESNKKRIRIGFSYS
jgi:hypothetical protein